MGHGVLHAACVPEAYLMNGCLHYEAVNEQGPLQRAALACSHVLNKPADETVMTIRLTGLCQPYQTRTGPVISDYVYSGNLGGGAALPPWPGLTTMAPG